MSITTKQAETKVVRTGSAVRQNLLQAFTVLVLIGFLYYPILRSLVAQWWHDPNYSHGFVVPIFCAYVIRKERRRLISLPWQGHSSGMLFIIAALAMVVLGSLGAENFLSRASFLVLLAGLLVYFAGWPWFRSLIFPWAVLFLMIPLPAIIFYQIALPLQFQASNLATGLLRLAGIPVLREGNIIHLPSLTLDVVEACSGLRSLVSLITLALIFGYLFERRYLQRSFLALSAIPIAVAANALRIAITGVLGAYWTPQSSEGFFHLFSGLVVFLVSFGMLLLVHAITSRIGRHFSGEPA